jgi:hypothetical protein
LLEEPASTHRVIRHPASALASEERSMSRASTGMLGCPASAGR